MALQKNFTKSGNNSIFLWKIVVFDAIMSIASAETETIVVFVMLAIANISASQVQEISCLPK